jgi:lipopolysaccharide/colanic/teichoic acid biosynthesis glycosyltransferase
MIFIAVLVKLTSPGPLFFTQERVGLDGKSFNIIKFRTMRIDAEKDGAQFAKPKDARVTPIGGFLRSWSLDELPQLANVILGNMSLVGPRPERPVFIREFRQRVPKYMLRHKVQAGMTGWAQVNGWRGNTSIEKRIEHDLFYIENWSLSLDLKILSMTILKGFRNKNAY